MQLCQWPHSTPDCRKILSQLLCCCWTTVQENKLLEQAVIPQGCPWNCIHAPLTAWQWRKQPARAVEHIHLMAVLNVVPNIAQLLHWVSHVLLNPRAEDRLQSYRAPKPGCLLRELSAPVAPAKTKPAAGVRPRLEHQALENKTWQVCGFFLQHLNTEVISGHQSLFKAAGGHKLKENDLLFSSWGWCMPQDCALLPNYNLRKYSDHEWDWWILGDFSTSILGAKLLASCPKLASQPKTEFMIERFIFLSSTVLFLSPTLTINNAQLSCEVN